MVGIIPTMQPTVELTGSGGGERGCGLVGDRHTKLSVLVRALCLCSQHSLQALNFDDVGCVVCGVGGCRRGGE